MPGDISQSFIKQFEKDVHLQYQQMGSKLKSTVRFKNNIKGASTTFQKIAKGTASTKTRHGLVPVMNLDHTPIECTLGDFYAGEWVDALDELKVNHDERQVAAKSGAYALGRKTDELIITAGGSTTNVVGDYTGVMNKALVLEAFALLNSKDVPDDGQRFAIVGPKQWNQLLNIKEFSESLYAGENLPFLKGTESRKWLGINWMMHTGLATNEDPAGTDCLLYHKQALGHASGCDVKTDITWHGDHAAHFVNNMMSQGSVLIDADGVIKIKCADEEPEPEEPAGD